ncbi:PREDICTED: tRNA (guanine(26)-N(2))-dimethyltransferase [Nelumbo nucifera]|uniref:tRNA (guanine(26)-N(2))-dimethyltransferase n=1 Tax=Nelumbo nucifera TaxID=4432 RepID=A0A1U7ZKA2_NELNU|nr:PREDICTED: tRNA (guanine(26)-N(2))-dimethyltransferase [Nelumbo nucifera]
MTSLFFHNKILSLPPPAIPPHRSLPSLTSIPNPRQDYLPRCFLPNRVQTLFREINGDSNSNHETERGLDFETGTSFFRHESAIGRDLGVLAASIYKRSKGSLRVLDAMCGCGIRSLRYLVQAEADFVWANDANEDYRSTILSNLSREARISGDERRWVVTHFDANRVMTECYLQRDFFDLIDIDSFGSDSSFFRSAYDSLKIDGLLYITSTDGFSSGGHRPHNSLASYGAYIRPMPYANEIGLRMLIGGALRDAAVLGYCVSPLFSYFSYHGPVFRVMLQVNRGKLPKNRYYGFISYCTQCGNSQACSWDELGQINCPCNNREVSRSVVVSGPLWTGPLHCATFVTEMLNLAEQWGWTGAGKATDLAKLLNHMIDESDPVLPFGYIKLDEIAKRAKINSPSLRTMITSLRKEGYAVSRSHIASNAIKTNCPMTMCIQIARELQLS